jgi:hypothetical protein
MGEDYPHNTLVKVTLAIGHGQPFVCIVKDRGPSGTIDLAPSALLAAGLDADYELLTTAEVEVLPKINQ